MTRNLYLGADLAPAIAAPTRTAFVAANGQILREVDRQRLPDPGRGPGRGDPRREARPGRPAGGGALAHRAAEPDAGRDRDPTATTVRYDYLPELLAELNKGRTRYDVVVVQNEFDLEAPADENGEPDDGPEPG